MKALLIISLASMSLSLFANETIKHKSCEAKLFSGFQGGLGAKELRANLIKELNQNGFKIQDQGVTNGLDLDVNTDLLNVGDLVVTEKNLGCTDFPYYGYVPTSYWSCSQTVQIIKVENKTASNVSGTILSEASEKFENRGFTLRNGFSVFTNKMNAQLPNCDIE
jgi:hypothetical protein